MIDSIENMIEECVFYEFHNIYIALLLMISENNDFHISVGNRRVNIIAALKFYSKNANSISMRGCLAFFGLYR